MKKEPVLIGQIMSALGLLMAAFTPVGEWVGMAGMENVEQLVGAVVAIVSAWMARSKVSPV